MADYNAKKMTSRGVSYMETGKRSESTLDSDVTITDEGYALRKVRQKLGKLPPKPPSLAGKSEDDCKPYAGSPYLVVHERASRFRNPTRRSLHRDTSAFSTGSIPDETEEDDCKPYDGSPYLVVDEHLSRVEILTRRGLHRDTSAFSSGSIPDETEADRLETNCRRHRWLWNIPGVSHVLLESRDIKQPSVHVMYEDEDSDFVHNELTVELKKRLMVDTRPSDNSRSRLTSTERALAFLRLSTIEQSSKPCIIIVVHNRFYDEYNQRYRFKFGLQQHNGLGAFCRQLDEAVAKDKQFVGRVLFIYNERTQYSSCFGIYDDSVLPWNLQACNFVVYPKTTVNQRERFLKTLVSWAGDPHMDPTRCAMLNEFGLLQHAVLQSPDYNTVHVIYGRTNKHFVHSELTEELKTRTGLQLVPPQSRVATSSFTAYSVRIVIVDRHDSVTNRLLREVVETSGHPVTNTLFIKKEDARSCLVEERLPRCTLMVYPGSELEDLSRVVGRQASESAVLAAGREDVRTLFWDNVSTMIGDPHMDPTHRAMLNEFGLVQHAVLQSPDHNTVHVIYGHTNRHFVHSELTEELKTRFGLQLVPPQSDVATSSSTAGSVLIVIVDRHDSVTDRLLREAVETSEHKETHTLFIKTERCPDWIETKFPRGTLVAYPEPLREMNSPFILGPLLVSSVDRALFWDNVSTVIDERLSLLHRPSDMSVEKPGEISMGVPRDKSPHKDVEVETSSFTEKKADSSQVTQAVEKNNVHIHEKTKGSSEKALDRTEDNDDMCVKRDAVETALHSSQGSDKMVSSKANSDSDEGHQIHVPSCAPLKYSDCERVAESSSDADTVDTPNDMSSNEEKDLPNQGAFRIDGSNDNPPPIVSMSWQHKGTFGHTGGVLRKPGSDVILHVPTQALGPDNSVDIHTAVCADIDHVHVVLELAEEEQVVSPLAEYWAGPDFRFQRPVCITLPLCLPPDPDLGLLRVYRVSRRQDGLVTLTSIKLQENNSSDCPSAQQDISNAHSVAGEYYVLSKDREKTEEADTDSDCSNRGSIPLDNKYQHSGQQQQVGYAWEESGHYEVSSEGQVLVTTDHFCGYVCVYCGRSQGPPELVAMVYGCHKRMSSLQRLASVDLYIWDKRVDIGDFRQEYDIGLTGSKVGRAAVSLLDEVKDTQLHAQIETLGPASSNWTHLQRPDGRPGNPKVQNRDVKMIVSCDAYGCTRKKSAPPSLVQWRLVAPVDLVTDTSLFAVLDLAHVMDDAVPAWTNRNNAERITSLQLEIPESRGNEDVNEPEGRNLQLSLTALSTDQLQMVLERVDFASYQRLLQTAHRYKREDDFRKQLIEVFCCHDSSSVMKAIASLLPSTAGGESVPRNLTPHQRNYSPASMPPETATGALPNGTVSPLAGMCFPNCFSESQGESTDVLDCSNQSNLDKQDMTSENGNAIKGSTSGPCEQLTPSQNSGFTSRTQTRTIHGYGKESDGAKISERIMRESHMTADQDGKYSGVIRQAREQCFSGLQPSQLKCLNRPQDSELSPMGLPSCKDIKDDVIFDRIDRDVIVLVAKQLSVDKAMIFFLDLGLSSQQYEVAKHKHGNAFDHVNMECFVMLGQTGKTIDVDKLTNALVAIDRFDILQDVLDLEDRKK